MIKISVVLLATTCLLAVAPTATYSQKPQVDSSVTRTEGDRPGAVIERSVNIQAKVVQVDYTKREISLQSVSRQGKVVTLKVGDGVTKLNEIKAGDLVKVNVTETFAITVAAPGAIADPAAGVTSQTTPDGKTVTAAERTSALVSAIDYQKREVTLQFNNGKSETFKVGPEVTRFNQIKQGDVILMSYTAAVAAAVSK